jgi:hypothetical protein
VNLFIEITTSLFQHLEEKDIFMEVYRNKFAKRLLNNKMQFDFEKDLIGKIKMTCGPAYTSKLEGMINDMKLGSDIDKRFKEEVKEVAIPVSIKVLTNGHWPSQTSNLVNLPP